MFPESVPKEYLEVKKASCQSVVQPQDAGGEVRSGARGSGEGRLR